MKKIIALLLVMMLALSACACGGVDNVRGEIINNNSEAEDTVIKTEEIIEETEEIIEETEAEFSIGKSEGDTYENSFIGLGFKLDEGWAFYDDEQIKELNNMTADIAGEEFEEMMKEADVVYDMYATETEGFNNININLEKVNPIQLIGLDIAANYEELAPTMQSLMENMGYTDYQYEIKTVEVDGKQMDAFCSTANLEGFTLYQTAFMIKCNGYLANVTVTSYFEDTTGDIIDNLYWLD